MELLTVLLRTAVAFGKPVGAGFHATRALVVLGLLAMVGVAGAAQSESLEKSVKAAYLSKFGLYVEWPDKGFPAPNTPLALCVAGEDSLGATLDKAAADQSGVGRPIVVRRLRTVGRDSGCHVLYIGGADALHTRQTIDAVRGTNVLTVSDVRGAQSGAIINFVINDNRVRFDIDEEAAAQNGLAISSKLLQLALNVKRKN
jgi:hypothetical protein